MKAKSIIGVILFFGINSLFAQSPASLTNATPGVFIENKGQIIDQDNKANHDVLFLLNTPGFNVQLRKAGFSYDVYSIDFKPNPHYIPSNKQSPEHSNPDLDSLVPEYHFHRTDIDLQNADSNSIIEVSAPSTGYLNYYSAGMEVEGVKRIRYYKSVIYKNIYPNIDLEFLAGPETGFKYNFIVHPGGDISLIQLNIEGPEISFSPPGILSLNATLGTIEEQIQAGSTLIVDPLPDRLWGTYFGGTGMETIGGCVAAKNGNVFLYGMTSSPANIATTGAHQTVYMGNSDAFLAKFDKDGLIQWATYFGGAGMEQNISASADQFQHVCLSGSTTSETNISTPGGFQPIKDSGSDAFLARFNPDGFLEWGTYYGGNESDLGSDCCFDLSGNIYMTGNTGSSTNIATPGAYQETLSGYQDAFLVMFDDGCNRIWGTYYGGEDFDEGWCCASDSLGHIYFAGRTSSVTGIASQGAHQTDYGGGTDGFLACFTQQGQRVWGTYYGGEGTDEIQDCVADLSGDLFITGRTFSTVNISTAGAFSTTYRGNGDGFATKFNQEGNIRWGTYYGGTNSDWLHSCAIDDSVNLFLAGPVTSSGLSTPGVYQPGLANISQDCILIKFDSSGVREWATYYGGLGADHGWCAVDTSWTVFLSGHTASPTGLSSPGSYQPVFGGGTTDTFLARFTQCMTPASAGSVSGPDTVCQSMVPVVFSVGMISGASGYTWHVPPGATITGNSGANSISVLFGPAAASGFLTVRGINYCDTGDSASLFITVKESPVPFLSGPDSLCISTPGTYSITAGMTQYLWDVSAGGTIMGGGSGSDSTLTVLWNVPGIHWVSVNFSDSNGCDGVNPAVKTIEITNGNPVNVTIAESSNNICQGSAVTFQATGTNTGTAPDYQWKVNSINMGINSPVFTYSPDNGDVVSCILTSSNTECVTNNPATSNPVTLIVNPSLPVNVSISASLNPFCLGNSVTFIASPANGGLAPVYQWRVNGIAAGSNSASFTYNPANLDSVRCVMTSSLSCVSGDPATSNTIPLSGLPAPVVTFASCFDTITTANARPFKLKGGIPLGGSYSGPGVSSSTGVFTPSVAGTGDKVITYSYTNMALCSSSKTRVIHVFPSSLMACGTTLVDIRDNQTYPTVQIGSQCWMAANLKFGTVIPYSAQQLDNCIPEQYRLQAGNPESAVYQWDELLAYQDEAGSKGLCPPGWHVPSEPDWNQLFTFYQGNAFSGSPLLYTGYSGFNVLLFGARFFNQNPQFADFASIIWSSTSHGSYKAWSHGVNEYNFSVSFYPGYRANAFAARCLRD